MQHVGKALRTAGLMLAYALAFLTSFFLARQIIVATSLETYGKYALILSIALMLRLAWYNIGQSTFARLYHTVASVEQTKDFQRALVLFLVLPVPLVLAAELLALTYPGDLLIGDFRFGARDVSSGLLLGIALGTNALLVELDNSIGNRLRSMCGLVLPGVIQLGIVMALGANARPHQIAYGSAIAIGVIAIAMLITLARAKPTPFKATEWHGFSRQSAIRFALPMFLWVPTALLARLVERWFGASVLTASDFASFVLIAMLTQQAMAAANTVLNRTFLPTIFRSATELPHSAHRQVRHLSAVLLALGTAGGALLWLAHPLIEQFFTLPPIEHLGSLLFLSALAAGIQATGDTQILHGQVARNVAAYTPYKYGTTLLFSALVIVLAPRWGLAGIVLAQFASAPLGLALSLWANKRTFGRWA